MKISKRVLIFGVILFILLYAFTETVINIVAAACTICIVLSIVRYGIKECIAFTVDSGIFQDPIRDEQTKGFDSEEHLRKITDNIQDTIIQIDKTSIIIYISPSCYKNFGKHPSYYLGRNLYGDVHPEDCEKVEKAVAEALFTKEFKPIEYRYLHEDGHYLWTESLGEIIDDENGEPCEIIINCRDITARKEKEEKIEYLSFHDPLTGLYNRRYFEYKLSYLIEHEVLPLSIIIGDVNGLKLTNDVFGHLEGDKLLVHISEALEKSCGPEDIITRWGGDEFAILLPNADEEMALKVVNSIINNCKEHSDESLKLSMALGASTKYSRNEDVQTTIKKAEEKMYRNKLLESRRSRRDIISSMQKVILKEAVGHSEMPLE